MISEDDKIGHVITLYPFIKHKLIERNKVFNNLNNPLIFKAVGRFARIKDVALMSGENLDELLKLINTEIEKYNNINNKKY